MQRKNNSEGEFAPVQLCLGYGKAQALVRASQSWCDCFCDACPPWEHLREDCASKCRSQRREKMPGRL